MGDAVKFGTTGAIAYFSGSILAQVSPFGSTGVSGIVAKVLGAGAGAWVASMLF